MKYEFLRELPDDPGAQGRLLRLLWRDRYGDTIDIVDIVAARLSTQLCPTDAPRLDTQISAALA